MKYLVSSHVNYYRVTLPRLLTSLQNQGLEPSQIEIVIGGSETQHHALIDGILHRFVEHNSFDNNPMIAYVEEDMVDGHIFVMHDTCEAVDGFLRLTQAIHPSAEYMSADCDGWFNMGMFSRAFLLRLAPFLIQMKNCTKQRAMMCERMYPNFAHSYLPYGSQKQINCGVCFPYATSVPRQKILLPDVGLCKFLANHAKAHRITAVP